MTHFIKANRGDATNEEEDETEPAAVEGPIRFPRSFSPTKAFGFRGWNHSLGSASEQYKSDMLPQQIWDKMLQVQYPHWDVLEGYAGAIYSRSFFDEQELLRLEEEAPCFFTDDVLIGAYLTLKGVERVARLPGDAALWRKNTRNEAEGALRFNTKRFQIQQECVQYFRNHHHILAPSSFNAHRFEGL